MTWVKVVFWRFANKAESVDLDLIARAEKRDKELGDPPGFAIFDRRLPHSEGEYWEYYFSPVAASACKGMLEPFSPESCEKPDREGLRIAYGVLVGEASWDLLK